MPSSGLNCCQGEEGPVVMIRDGFLRGRTERTKAGTVYDSFRGIPYAKPPIGELRFKAPVPATPWRGVRDAGQDGNGCKQPGVKVMVKPRSWAPRDIGAFMAIMPTLIGRVKKLFRQCEDCLYLNVFSPEVPPCGETVPLRPVLVWVHGGGFLVGDGDSDVFGPEYFVDMGIVVVTVNYRLGPFGFLAVGTEAAPGNAGLKDQALALRWVRDNVAVFGGDPDRVTLYGESAGAACVHMHTLSPLSRGLFHRAIASSGSAIHDWAMTSGHVAKARELAKILGIEAEDPKDLVAALQKESADRLMKGTLRMRNEERFVGDELAFVPVVEPDIEGAFLSEDPATILQRGAQAPVPLMIGTNSREGLLCPKWHTIMCGLALNGNPTSKRRKPQSEEEMAKLDRRKECQLFLTEELYHSLSPGDRAECHKSIMQFYFGSKKLCKDTLPQFVDLFGDICFINPLYRVTRLHAQNKSSPVFVYYLNFDGRLAFFKRLLKLKYQGVSHGDELGYLFRIGILPEIPLNRDSPEKIHQRELLKLWGNFIHTGNPNAEGTDPGKRWTPAWQDATMQYMDLGQEFRMRREPINERVFFWDALYRNTLDRPLAS